MMSSEQASDQRRPQISDDDTGIAQRAQTNRSEDTSAQPDTAIHEDIWVKGFLARLTGLVRDIGRSRKQD
jgi:hypothetical protein